MSLPNLNDAAVPMRPYQAAWFMDRSRRKLAVKSRRVGFTFATTAEIADDAADHRTRWLIVSRTQDTVKEAVQDVANHFRAMQLAERRFKGFSGSFDVQEIPTDLFFDGVRVMKFQIELPNRSVVSGVTAAPDALRGFGGNVFLDEFAFHKDSYALWRAASAATMLGHRLIVVSTPNYEQGKYFDLCRHAKLTDGHAPEDRQQGIWSAHFVDIHTAVAQGFPVSIEDCHELAGDEDTFQQEYCCAFLADGECFIGFDLITAAESVDAQLDAELSQCTGPLYLGMDIGRRKDRTVIWVVEKVGDVLVTRAVRTMTRASFAEQEAVLYALLPWVERAALDATGMGMQLGERARAKFGAKVEPVEFSLPVKERLAIETKRLFEDRRLRIPETAAIRSSISAVKRYVSVTGKPRFDAARTESGHADEFWGLALACGAACERQASFKDARLFGGVPAIGAARIPALQGVQF